MKERIRIKDIGKENLEKSLQLQGYVDSIRKMGGLLFLYLRDETGMLQVQFDRENMSQEDFDTAETLRDENIIALEGRLAMRPENQIKRDVAKGEFELMATGLELLVKGKVPPFELSEVDSIKETLKGRHRYLELRSAELSKRIRFRNELVRRIREYYYALDFQELETPFLIKSTPEGARDFIVPSRNFKGKFYALPQSPQLLKQILMGSGFERYFQIARCFRDEDLRADRQPEFSQLDVEMAFTCEEEIYKNVEALFDYIGESMDLKIETPFPRMTYAQAMERYASDKPDMRNPLFIEDFTGLFSKLNVDFIKKALDKGARVRGIRVPAVYSKSAAKKIEELLKKEGAGGSLFVSRADGEYKFTLGKFANGEFYSGLELNEGESIFFQMGKGNEHILSFLRDHLGRSNDLLSEGYKFLWVTEFPLFLYDEELKSYTPAHHPFTMPRDPKDLENVKDPSEIISRAYDLVLNGAELGSGSIRINLPGMQKKIFNMLSIDENMQKELFGFFLEAMEYGLPPHGGVALGIGRTAIGLYGSGTLRDFILFPKTTAGNCLMTGSPSAVSKDQLSELRLALKEEKNEN